jgi:hypothetical protein
MVATELVNVPAVQSGLAFAHLSTPFVAEKVVPAVHAVHWRSELAEPSAETPKPTPHVLHSLHALSPVLAVNDPFAQAAHFRSADKVATEVMNVPTVHAALTALHASAFLVAENEPSWQAMHWRSAVADPAAITLDPGRHEVHVEQARVPAAALNVPCAQLRHTRSLDAVASSASYFPAGQPILEGWHLLRSFVVEYVPLAHKTQ